MTFYPFAIDSDNELPRVDDDLSDFESKHINALREAIFSIEKTLGINIQGSLNSLVERLSISIADNGKIKESALSDIALVTLPIIDSMIGSNAGIKESKLTLYHSTTDLYTLILSNSNQIETLMKLYNFISSDFNFHLLGSEFLSDGITSAKHKANAIDLNQDLLDKNSSFRNVKNVQSAIESINGDLINHENSILNAHIASSIIVNTDNFQQIPLDKNDAQKVFEYFDQNEILNLGQHRATQHANGIPKIERSESMAIDSIGLCENIIPATKVISYLVHNPNSSPVDNLSIGDDLIRFIPDNSNFLFDAQFSLIKSGDVATINYGNGIQTQFLIDSIRFSPGNEWIIRINGINLYDSDIATARIDRPNFDINTFGILATAPVTIRNDVGTIYTDILTSIIIADPKSACTLGLGFDAGQINSIHYKLYLELYPTGKPTDKIIKLPFIDISGDAGASPGKYTLESIIQSTNNNLRRIGFNYRFIAFSYKGEFAIGLADSIGGASFAIVSGNNESGTLQTDIYTENIIGGNTLDDFDALGFGTSGSNIASPAFQNTWPNSTAATNPTKIISPLKKRYYFVNGLKNDSFASTYLADENGFWDGYIAARTPIGNSNVEVTYEINLDLRSSGLKPGKTIVVQPAILYSDANYNDVDYGRFIIKDINFENCNGIFASKTLLTVVNGLHALGVNFGNSSSPPLPIKIHFSYDSVGFNDQNIIDTNSSTNNYARFHEIFINQNGKTFSHERLRFPKQNETFSLLATANWHISEVSSKFRGYQGSNPLIFNKYIRLFIINYDATTGEFDGYLGQPSGVTSIKQGPIVHGRKNIPIRLYDETNIDFIDFVYAENSSSPGTNILSASAGKYVDCELFPSLQLDDELFCLSTCEVTWAPNSNENIIQFLKDKRQFGSIDEIDFTDSAKEFISITDKYLHENGIIRGYEFISTGAIDSGEMFFKGGLAFIDGIIVQSNQQNITIPRIYSFGTTLPQDVNWIICVNKSGNLELILEEDPNLQYFATPDGSSNYYIPAYSFANLINTRKDLTPIYFVTVTVGSLTISSTQDIRKFVYQQNSKIGFELSVDNKNIGNFYDLYALKFWINHSNNINQQIFVKGNLTTDLTLDFTGFNKLVFFDGKNATFNLSATKGILIDNNVAFDGFTFNYSGDNNIYTSGALINAMENNGCIVNILGVDSANIIIRNCIFNSDRNTQRPPFILFLFQKGQIIENINISNNIFNDLSATTDINKSQAVIAFFTMNSGSSVEAALAKNIIIRDNICDKQQGIYFTTISESGAKTPGLNTFNCSITNNSCGIIGIVPSGYYSTNSEVITSGNNFNIEILNNKCFIIGNFFDEGNSILDIGESEYGFGNILIKENQLHWLVMQAFDIAASFEYSSLKIEANTFFGYNNAYLLLFSPTIENYALQIANDSSEPSHAIITGNTFNYGKYSGSIRGYEKGIICGCGAIITDNIIKGLLTSGVSIGIDISVGSGTGNKYYNISNNQIIRGPADIINFIKLPSSGTNKYGICKNNFFDSPTTSGSDTTTIGGSFNQFVVESNINQTVTFRNSLYVGTWGSGAVTPFIFGDSTLLGTTTITGIAVYQGGGSDQETQLHYDILIAGNDRFLHWAFQLDDILPKNSYIVSLSLTANSVNTFTISEFTLSLVGTGLTTLNNTGAPTTITNAGNTLTITTGVKDYIVNNTIRPIARLSVKLNDNASNTIDITSITINYRW